MATSTTNHTSIHGPESNKLGILGNNIVVRLAVYYTALAIVGFLGWRYLPTSIKDLVHSATQPLVGLSNPPQETSFMTPDPQIDALPPLAVVLMSIISSLAAIAFCVPVSWTYMFTRQKKGYNQTIVHTLLLLPV